MAFSEYVTESASEFIKHKHVIKIGIVKSKGVHFKLLFVIMFSNIQV